MAIGGQYTLNIKGILDTSNIRRQLEAMGKSAKFDTNSSKRFKETLGGIGDTAGKTKSKLDSTVSGIGAMNQGLGTSIKRFGSVMGKVALFGGATTLISGVTNGVADMVHQVFELDASLTELKKVSSLSGNELVQFTDRAYEAGAEVARTGREMIDSATMFTKSGFTENQSLKLATVAEKFRNIADAELTSAEASGFLISQMKAFNITAGESEHIIDAVNEVANNYAVGTNDLQLALSKTGSAMATTGNTYEETIGIITAGTEVMVGQSSKVK